MASERDLVCAFMYGYTVERERDCVQQQLYIRHGWDGMREKKSCCYIPFAYEM